MQARGYCSQQQAAGFGSWLPCAARGSSGSSSRLVHDGSAIAAAAAAPQRLAPLLTRRAVPRAAAAAEVDAAPAPSSAPSPANNVLPQPVPWQQAGQGLVFYAGGGTTFRVWAPHASAVVLQVVPASQFVAPPPPVAGEGGSTAPSPEQTAQADEVAQPGMVEYHLERHDDDFGLWLVGVGGGGVGLVGPLCHTCACCAWGAATPHLPSAPQPVAALAHGAAYRLVLTGPGGGRLVRRDPWARSADPASSWCFAHSPAAYTWKHTDWQPLSYDKVPRGALGSAGGGVWRCGAPHLGCCAAAPPGPALMPARPWLALTWLHQLHHPPIPHPPPPPPHHHHHRTSSTKCMWAPSPPRCVRGCPADLRGAACAQSLPGSSTARRRTGAACWAASPARLTCLPLPCAHAQGTLRAAIDRLPHVAACGFTLLELMPCQEHSDPWGYNPRSLLSLHRPLGTPEVGRGGGRGAELRARVASTQAPSDTVRPRRCQAPLNRLAPHAPRPPLPACAQDMAAFVDAAHGLGMGVMMDVVLHHGAPSGNMLWDWDGW